MLKMYPVDNTGYTTNGVSSTLPTSHVVVVTQPMHAIPSTAHIQPGMGSYPVQPVSVPPVFPPQFQYTTYPTFPTPQQQQHHQPSGHPQQPMSYVLLPHSISHSMPSVPSLPSIPSIPSMHPQCVVNMNVSNNVYHPPSAPVPCPVPQLTLSSPSIPASGLSSLYITRPSLNENIVNVTSDTNHTMPRLNLDDFSNETGDTTDDHDIGPHPMSQSQSNVVPSDPMHSPLSNGLNLATFPSISCIEAISSMTPLPSFHSIPSNSKSQISKENALSIPVHPVIARNTLNPQNVDSKKGSALNMNMNTNGGGSTMKEMEDSFVDLEDKTDTKMDQMDQLDLKNESEIANIQNANNGDSNSVKKLKRLKTLKTVKNEGGDSKPNRHIRVHTDERPYRCTYCPRTFRQQHSLKGHVRTHTGERPYQCTFCRRKFAAKCNLKVHIRTHTGERPYQCTECNKQYASKSGFNAHRRKFH